MLELAAATGEIDLKSVDRKVWRCLRRAQPSLKNSSLRYRFFENVEVLIGLDK
jgi:hypothetical protein